MTAMPFSQFYEDYAKTGFAQVKSKKVASLALHFLQSPVLDAGCYFGEKTKMLGKHFEKVDGCDISKTAVQKAKKKHKGLEFFVCDLEQPNLKFAKKYNSVFAAELIEHVFDTQAFLKNCFNALNKGGILFLTTPNVIQVLNRLRIVFGDTTPISGDKAHIRFFKPKTLKQELEKAGFTVIHLNGYNVRPFLKHLPMPLNWYEGIIAVAKK